jgi:transposase
VRKYSEEVKKFIAENVQGTRIKDLAEMVNTKFGTAFTYNKMRSYLKNNKLKNGMPTGIPKDMPTDLYPAEIRSFIKENHAGVGPKEMAALLNKTFGTNYTHSQMKGWYARHKLNSGIKGYFEKGQIPWNKGKKGINYPGAQATQFKPGNVPHTWVPIGSERITKDGYIQIKIQDGKKQKNWRGKHILIWEAANGPLPEGHAIIFGDGNKRNFDLGNLLLVSRAQLVRMNQKGLIQDNADLTKTGILIADVYNKIGERKRAEKKRRER